MKSNSVVFVAFEERENLGIGYMHAILSEAGYDVQIIDFRKDAKDILEEILDLNPLVVGFSVIFENHIYDFRDLIEYLRSNGIQCHFTAGGHFASLRPDDLFELIPSLDSVVRFEGEYTILDLVNQLHQDAGWKEVSGISCRYKGSIKHNQLRPLEPDLDRFPFPFRSEIHQYVLEKKYSTLVAGRGCIYHCAFCDIREFYGQPPGPVKRIRKPEKVVEEIEYLHKEHGCCVFLFQDDDFPVQTNRTTTWTEEFCRSLREKKLAGKIMWKINCRPDEIDLDLFDLMKAHGLFKVYLGIEDGTDAGLLRMNKRMKVSDQLEGIQILKELGIVIDYGFMLFQPLSTYSSINQNLTFLEQICQDGYMPLTFLKMMPYLATGIERELREEGRLKGKPGFLDYDFLDRSMDEFYAFVNENFNTWLFAPDGLRNFLKWGRNYLSVSSFFHGFSSEIEGLYESLSIQVANSNRFIIKTMKELSALFESGLHKMKNDSILDAHKSSIEYKHNLALLKAADLIKRVEAKYLIKGQLA